MNPMQQMLQRAQKMQRELAKAKEALASQEFSVSKSGMVEIVVTGDRKIKSLKIDKDALDPENAEMLEDTIAVALNEVMEKVTAAEDELESKVTGGAAGLF